MGTKISRERDEQLDAVIKAMSENFYTMRQACEILGLTRYTLAKYAFCDRNPTSPAAKSQQRFPAKKWGNYLCIPKEVVDEYRHERRPPGRPPGTTKRKKSTSK